MARNFVQVLSDVCFLAGCGLLTFGAYLLNPIAAVFTGGSILLVIGFLLGVRGEEADK